MADKKTVNITVTENTVTLVVSEHASTRSGRRVASHCQAICLVGAEAEAFLALCQPGQSGRVETEY